MLEQLFDCSDDVKEELLDKLLTKFGICTREVTIVERNEIIAPQSRVAEPSANVIGI
jgi:hypothetical protein